MSGTARRASCRGGVADSSSAAISTVCDRPHCSTVAGAYGSSAAFFLQTLRQIANALGFSEGLRAMLRSMLPVIVFHWLTDDGPQALDLLPFALFGFTGLTECLTTCGDQVRDCDSVYFGTRRTCTPGPPAPAAGVVGLCIRFVTHPDVGADMPWQHVDDAGVECRCPCPILWRVPPLSISSPMLTPPHRPCLGSYSAATTALEVIGRQ